MTVPRHLALRAGQADLVGQLKEYARAAHVQALHSVSDRLIERYCAFGKLMLDSQELWWIGAELSGLKGSSRRNLFYLSAVTAAWGRRASRINVGVSQKLLRSCTPSVIANVR
jgi:hypothetical protein